jgi:hypothetical protein
MSSIQKTITWLALMIVAWALLIAGLSMFGTFPGILLQAAALTLFLRSFRYIEYRPWKANR